MIVYTVMVFDLTAANPLQTLEVYDDNTQAMERVTALCAQYGFNAEAFNDAVSTGDYDWAELIENFPIRVVYQAVDAAIAGGADAAQISRLESAVNLWQKEAAQWKERAGEMQRKLNDAGIPVTTSGPAAPPSAAPIQKKSYEDSEPVEVSGNPFSWLN